MAHDGKIQEEPLGYTVNEILQMGILPMGRSAVYAALKSGEIPSVRINGKLIIPRIPMRRKFGAEE